MEHYELEKTLEHAVDQEIEWATLSLVNCMLKELGVDAKFETNQQNIYFKGKEGEVIKLIVGNRNKKFEE